MIKEPYMTGVGKKNEESRLWWTRLLTKQMQFMMDLLVLVSAFFLAYILRFDFHISEIWLGGALTQVSYVVMIQFAALTLTGVYSFVWKYVGLAEVKAFIAAAAISSLPIFMLRLGLPDKYLVWQVPLSVIVMDTLLAFSGVLGVRVLRRAMYERYEKRRKETRANTLSKRRVLLIGAGRAGVLAVKEIQGRGDIDLDVKGFVDDDLSKQGSVIHRVKVLGTTEDLPRLVRSLDIDHVVITIAQASRQELRSVVEICEKIPIKVRIIPGLFEILQGRVKVSRIRDVQIEDLLGRELVRLDEDEMQGFLAGKTVMVTGAGGSIGSELARQVARFEPAALLLVERAEFALFNIDRELRDLYPDLEIMPLTSDVCDEGRMRTIFAKYKPQVVVHAAAHKHVPMMEFNPTEAVKNNVLGTRLLGEIAGQSGTEAFVLISTDKAVRPSSMMGASKRVAELVIQDLDGRYETRYVAVRFGNVIGSAGSVIPIFREQISKGGPVTVTHPEMVRYFMTIPEAVQLVLQAGAMGEGGEIFILDMGEPVRILDLARDTITLSGFKPHEDIEIVFTGIRPGEKLFEELDTDGEHVAKTRHPKIFIGKIAAYPEAKVGQALQRLAELSRNGHDTDLRAYLNELLPEASLHVTVEPVAAIAEQPVVHHATARPS
ncbi:MAG: polysaccharide biosynthesis protein [Pyrinomonadaceae bacterium]|nr:polysaccharide biosynthesis protein [Pyrinomonadaceae bacterium]